MLATSHNRVAAGTTHSRNKPRAARMKQRLWLCSVLGLLLMAFAAVSLSHLRSGRETAAFSCYRLSPSDVEDLVKEVAVPPPLLEPRRQSLETVTLLLVGLPSLHAPDTLMRVLSSRINAPIYQGTPTNRIPVQVGDRLRGEDGGDNLRFELLSPAGSSICVSEQQRAFNVWQAGPQVKVEFLPEARMDETTGTPRRFLVDGQ